MDRLRREHLRTLVVCCGLSAATIGAVQNTPGVFYDAVSSDLGLLRGSFALHATVQQLALAVGSMALPRLLRRFSVKTMAGVSALAMVATTAAMAAAGGVVTFCVLAALRGLAAGACANLLITIVVNGWFQRRNGTFTSLVMGFAGLAGAVFSPLLMKAILALGWRSAYGVQAALIGLGMLPALVLPFAVHAEDAGVEPYGAGHDEEEVTAQAHPSLLPLRSSALWVFAVFVVLHSMVTGLAQHISGFVASAGMGAELGALMLSLCLVGNCCSKLCIGVLSDRMGAVRASVVMIVANVAALALILCGVHVRSVALLAMGSVLYGSVYAVGAVGIPLLTRHLFGDACYAEAYARVGAAHFMGCAAGLPAMGYVFDFTGSYDLAVFGCLGIHVIDLAIIFSMVRRVAGARVRGSLVACG